jgi:hypothetical protein
MGERNYFNILNHRFIRARRFGTREHMLPVFAIYCKILKILKEIRA